MTNGDVGYTVKELISRVEGKLDALSVVIQQKANAHEVQELQRQVDRLQDKITQAEVTFQERLTQATVERGNLKNEVTALTTRFRWLATIGGAAILIVNIAQSAGWIKL